ncbi:MAG: hypothetical protein IT235_02755 [Bacteroidia bacterium]|nr:hypothetical protein [Bacteroidia bacterium]
MTSFGQTKLTTKDLEYISDTFGVDSALEVSGAFGACYDIDLNVALQLALKCNNLENYTKQFSHFNKVGQLIKDKELNSKAFVNLKQYRNIIYDTLKHKLIDYEIPDELFLIFIFQNDKSITIELKAEFNFWEQCADSIQENYPDWTKRFIHFFTGESCWRDLHNICKQNSFKIAWTLNKFEVEGFTTKKINSLRRQLFSWQRNQEMDRFKYQPYQYGIDTITLRNSYSTIDEINIADEPELSFKKENLDKVKCWDKILSNEKVGLYDFGCVWNELGGYGKTLRIELIAPNKLKVSTVSSWIN